MENVVISLLNAEAYLTILNETIAKVNELRLVLSQSFLSVEKLLVFVLAIVGALGSFQRSLTKGLKKGGRKVSKRAKPSLQAMKTRKKQNSKKSSVATKRVKKCSVAQ